MATASPPSKKRSRTWLYVLGGGVLVVLGALGVGAWWFQRLTALPDWYAVEAPDELEEPDVGWVVVPDEAASEPSGAPKEAQHTSKRKSPRKSTKRATMRGFHRRGVIDDDAVAQAMRASRATFEDGKLEAGVVIDLRRVDVSGMSDKDRKFYDKVAGAFPRLAKRDVYVALRDRPEVKDGWLRLGPDPEVVVGKTRYSLRNVAKRLGVSEKKARKELDRAYRRLKLRDPAAGPPPMEDDGLRPEDI